jgi:LAO/AO transport system kinase
LADLERLPLSEPSMRLLDLAWRDQSGVAIGITGPPGVGKSTLLSSLLQSWRGLGRRIAVLAVDPTSKRSGGSILGDRTRLALPPDDPEIFIRSLAAGRRLGGTAQACAPMLVLLRSLFDVVVVETVGIGQSETEIADLVDVVLLAVQPASGDTLQFLKAGIAEIPDLAVVTKADLGDVAERTRLDLASALAATGHAGEDTTPVLMVSATEGRGTTALIEALDHACQHRVLPSRRQEQGLLWVEACLLEEVGRRGLEQFRASGALDPSAAAIQPFRLLASLLDTRTAALP